MAFEPALVKTRHQGSQRLCSQLFSIFLLQQVILTKLKQQRLQKEMFIFHRPGDWPKFNSYMLQVSTQKTRMCECLTPTQILIFRYISCTWIFFSLFASLFSLREARSGGFPCSSVFQLLDFLTFHLPYKFRTRSSQANGEIQLGCSVPTRFSELESLESE